MTNAITEQQRPAGRLAGRLTVAEVDALIDQHFAQVHAGGRTLYIEAVGARHARVRMLAHERNIRPGNTVSGPSMFTLADFSIYVAILGTLGEDALQAVTTNLNITFMQRPEQRDILCDINLIKLGKRLVVAEAHLTSVGQSEIIAHAIGTYALPTSGTR
jgi:uncharacterized protein (TIGR00369 family)